MKKISFLLLIGFLLVLPACVSSVDRLENAAPYSYNGEKYQKVVLTIREDATDDLDDIVRFDQDELVRMIEKNMEVKGLIAANSTKILKVEITDVRVRSTFNAFMWGFMAGNDHIEGDISLNGENPPPLHIFHVSASYALGGFMGFKETRMGWLYEEFAELTLQEILGEKPSGA